MPFILIIVGFFLVMDYAKEHNAGSLKELMEVRGHDSPDPVFALCFCAITLIALTLCFIPHSTWQKTLNWMRKRKTNS